MFVSSINISHFGQVLQFIGLSHIGQVRQVHRSFLYWASSPVHRSFPYWASSPVHRSFPYWASSPVHRSFPYWASSPVHTFFILRQVGQVFSFSWRRMRLPNIGLTFKSVPERSEGLAWFVHCCSAQTMPKESHTTGIAGGLRKPP